jgi:hypothetical protein
VSDPDDRTQLALTTAGSLSTTALDALLAISPLAPLTDEEIVWLVEGRAIVGRLRRSLEARRRARVVELHGPPGQAVRGPL